MPRQAIAKGIVKMGDGRFEARVKYQGTSKRSELHSMYVGMFSTLESAVAARYKFIVNMF
tara:strand:- start:998 stop:1177 length:180 start_codon:yes stop_codon:yes gene_type:complete